MKLKDLNSVIDDNAFFEHHNREKAMVIYG